MDKKLKKYGKSKKGNFEVIDTIGVPHPYCITPKHMYGDGMYMDAERIRTAEKENNAVCDICRKIQLKDGTAILSYDDHKQALLVNCKEDIKDNKELHKYLLSIKDICIKDKFEGVAFKKDFS